jgi:hypothetical protein
MRGMVIRLRASGIDTHLWFVVSDPHPETNQVLAFNLTNVKNYPTSRCILEPGEHPQITLKSAVRYFSPKIWDIGMLQKLINNNTFEQFQNASEEVIQKIISGAYEDDTPNPCFKYLPPKPA